MTIDYQTILEKLKNRALLVICAHPGSPLKYHNHIHTEQVVAACTQMADYYHLNEVDRFTLLIAAWFHDVAYREGAAGHEQRGAATAAALLKDEGIETPIIDAVSACILATRLPQHPTNLLEQIICDADLFHLGTDDFEQRNKLLHMEIEALTHKKLKKKLWWQDSFRLLEQHHYFTDFCQQILQPKKIENMAHLRKKIENRKERKEKSLRNVS